MKTSEATELQLDLLVAKCENVEPDENNRPIWFGDGDERVEYTPSTDWAQGGPIIEREFIWLEINEGQCYAHKNGLDFYEGETPLIAAMRCYVASKLGDEVDVPEELCPPTA
jgi:hypothetical protein